MSGPRFGQSQFWHRRDKSLGARSVIDYMIIFGIFNVNDKWSELCCGI